MKTFKTIIFYILSFTWGLPMTLFGGLVALGCLIAGIKPKRFHQFIYFEFGEGWGGFEGGIFFFCNKDSSLQMKQHEAGHGIQNIMLGVFMPFVISIPSAIHYWYRKWLVKSGRKQYSELVPYNSIWFERWATELGQKYYK